jgi:hypothetical protein
MLVRAFFFSSALAVAMGSAGAADLTITNAKIEGVGPLAAGHSS